MNRFNNITKPLMWFMALLLTAFIAGCGGGSSSSTSVPSLLNSAKSIDTFSLAWTTGPAPGTATGIIDQTLQTIKMTVPHATLLTPMKATFTASPGVSVTVGSVPQVSGTTDNDYTNPVSYKVTAADGTYSTYTVVVSHDQTVTSLAITPPSATTPKGATQQFVATATYLDTSHDVVTTTASWTSAASGVASVGLHTGLATGVTASSGVPVTITAAFGGQTKTATMIVSNAALLSIAVSPATGATTPVGGTQQFVAIGTYTDSLPTVPLSYPVVTTTATWTSGAGATVDANGLATGVTDNPAPETITATIGSVFGTADLLVTPAPGPNLRSTARFAVLSGALTNDAATTHITGDVGASGLTGTAPTIISGAYYTTGSTEYGTAITDLALVIADANDTTKFPCGTYLAQNLSGKGLTPGVTCINANAAILNTGVVTLNGPGVYIIRTTGALSPAATSSVVFGAGTNDTNTTVFWVVGGGIVGTPSTWMGTILSNGAITLNNTDTLIKGRVLSNAAVTLFSNTITKP